MSHLNLLKSLPKTKRNVKARKKSKDPEVIRKSKEYGFHYFDGDRKFGYGGYLYDGRWRPVAKDIINHYGLTAGDKVLDVGCAKGFLVYDLMKECSGLDVLGLDVSIYAIMTSDKSLIGRLMWGSADYLPFEDNYFDLVLSINTVHNLPRPQAKKALQEIMRVSKGKAFVQVDSYFTEEEKDIFESWVLTAEFHGYPEDWLKLFEEAGYKGDYDWTLV